MGSVPNSPPILSGFALTTPAKRSLVRHDAKATGLSVLSPTLPGSLSPPPGDGTGSARRPTLSRACTAAESPEPRPLTPPTESRLRCGHANPASPSVTLRGSDDRGAEEQAAISEEPLSLTSRPSWNFLAKSLWGKDVTEAELVAFTVGRHNGRVGRTFSAYMRRLALVMM